VTILFKLVHICYSQFNTFLDKRSTNGQATMKTVEIQLANTESQWYTFRELQWHLAKFRGKRVPPTTLKDWLKVLSIQADEETGCYSHEDLRWLARYCLWLRRGGTSKGFQSIQHDEIRRKSYAS
jgi:hypothetical protein